MRVVAPLLLILVWFPVLTYYHCMIFHVWTRRSLFEGTTSFKTIYMMKKVVVAENAGSKYTKKWNDQAIFHCVLTSNNLHLVLRTPELKVPCSHDVRGTKRSMKLLKRERTPITQALTVGNLSKSWRARLCPKFAGKLNTAATGRLYVTTHNIMDECSYRKYKTEAAY